MMFRKLATAAAMVVIAQALPASAQDMGGPPGPPPGQGGGFAPGGPGGPGGNFDPEEMRQRMEEMRKRMDQRMKEQLGVTDEEYSVLKPKIDKVRQSQMQANTRGFGGPGVFGAGGPGGPGGPGGMGGPGGKGMGGPQNQASDPVATAMRALREVLDNKGATAEQVNSKLQDLRDARDKAREGLKTAQAELKELVTPRQEAVLVTLGVLE